MAANTRSGVDPSTIDAPSGGDHPSSVPTAAGVFDRVVVAVSETTDPAVVETAAALAAAHGATLDALSVVETNPVEHWDVVVERREATAEAALDEADEVAAARDVSVEKRLRYGTPAEEIRRYAEGNDADLVVLGEPSRTGLRRLLSPRSVTASLRRDASLPVFTVPNA